ncbi:MAG: potassium-transporting ATPase subunit KdpA [Deltaproteobacteria bacterium]|nr:potassium-transporting ATPase subunit KdpA [Deltaproteobacteria bacterium]
MSTQGWLQILVYCAVLLALTPPVGRYLHRVFASPEAPLGRLGAVTERALLRACGVSPAEQTWRQYAGALLTFSAVSVLYTYLLQRVQVQLPLNPAGLGNVEPSSAFNTAASFVTNTNWQGYSGESTMGYLVQMAALGWNNFTSAAVGLAVAVALARGLTRPAPAGDAPATLGNFWVDLLRGIFFVLLPACVVYALALVSQGVLQNLDAYVELTTLEGAQQVLAMGPVASQEAIKMLGTNGGGFFNANSAHPFENPNGVTNFLQMLSIFVMPAGLTYAYGLMAGNTRHGWAILASMGLLFLLGVGVSYAAEAQASPAFAGLAVAEDGGNMEGKEVRFGIANSALFATVTTDASCGAVNSMHDSFSALGGLVPMVNIQLGEVIFGGVGAGLMGMLIMVLLSVFLAGLMVGRTPEYLGKKIEPRDIKLVTLYILIFPLVILAFTGWAAVAEYGVSSLNNAGPHGLSELLYAYSSAAGNNGSAFAGLSANTLFYNVTLGVAVLAGRFWLIIPALAVAGTMARKKTVPPSPGTFPTDGALFTVLLTGVVVIVGALTFFPALALGPLVEHFLGAAGKVF